MLSWSARLSLGALFVAQLVSGSGCPPPVTAIDSGLPPPDLAGPQGDPDVRLAHFVAAAPAFDVCVKGSSDSSFAGPILRSNGIRAGGVPYGSISAPITYPAGVYQVRAVPGAATDCTKSLGNLPDLTLAPIVAGQHYTVAAVGDFGKAATIKFIIIEDSPAPQAGKARFRFLNAAPDLPNADLGSGSAASYMARLTAATYGGLGTSSGQSYVTVDAQNNATWTVRPNGQATDSLVLTNKVTMAAGTTYTLALMGVPNGAFPLALAVCNDTAAPIMGLYACQELN